MAPFYGWDSIASKLQSSYEEVVYLLPLTPQCFLVLILIDPWSYTRFFIRKAFFCQRLAEIFLNIFS